MSELRVVGCELDGCPILQEGRCLENFEGGRGCPHALTEGVASDDSPDRAGGEPTGNEADSAVADSEEPSEAESDEDEHVELGGDESLTVSQADEVAQTHGAKVVLVAGEFQSGKTTLVAEVYGRFLSGPYCGWSFAGSDCLYALDRRYHTTRASSGLQKPDMPRTEEEDMRLLDLRLRKGRRRLPLMFSDTRGEFFDNVSQGGRVADEVPLARRADCVLVLVPGDKIGNRYLRAEAVNLARQLIGGLTEPDGLPAKTPLAIVLSKADLVDDAGRTWFEAEAKRLQEFARTRGSAVVEAFQIAARPEHTPYAPQGLEPLFEWLCKDSARPAELPAPEPSAMRSYWRWGAE